MEGYLVLIEKTPEMANYSAWVPDLPGCVSTGRTLEETENNVREAIALHLRGMREDGDRVPALSHVVSLGEGQPGSDAYAVIVSADATPTAA